LVRDLIRGANDGELKTLLEGIHAYITKGEFDRGTLEGTPLYDGDMLGKFASVLNEDLQNVDSCFLGRFHESRRHLVLIAVIINAAHAQGKLQFGPLYRRREPVQFLYSSTLAEYTVMKYKSRRVKDILDQAHLRDRLEVVEGAIDSFASITADLAKLEKFLESH